jgi:hypothetical protein
MDWGRNPLYGSRSGRGNPLGPGIDGMTSPHRTNFYQRYSVGIMAILVFLLPMVVVGAIKAKSNNRNDVKGWLRISRNPGLSLFPPQFPG